MCKVQREAREPIGEVTRCCAAAERHTHRSLMVGIPPPPVQLRHKAQKNKGFNEH